MPAYAPDAFSPPQLACEDCGREFDHDADEPVYYQSDPVWSGRHPRCPEHYEAARRYPQLRMRPYVAQCATCERTLFYEVRRRRPDALRFCSPECAHEHRNAKRHAPRVKRACAVCERVFTPPRSDARYCSNACRQRAHRQRHAA